MLISICLNRILIVLFVLVLIAGCAKEGDNPVIPDDSENYMWIHFSTSSGNADSTKLLFKDLPKFNTDGEEAIQLNLFIDTLLVPKYFDKNNNPYDSRYLYSYQIVGDDGFCASNKGYCNNTWEHFLLGHILISGRRIIFPDDKIDLPGAYNIKSARHIYIHRKFDLDFTDSTLFVELKKILPVQVTNSDGNLEQAIPLKDAVTNVVENSGSYKYNILSLDNFGPSEDMTWEKFQTGYWLLSSGKTMFTDTSLTGGSYKLKVLEKIFIK